MALFDGTRHLTTLTSDMDRLIATCERLFGAHVTLDLEEDGFRHAVLELGPATVLHLFQIPEVDVQQSTAPPR